MKTALSKFSIFFFLLILLGCNSDGDSKPVRDSVAAFLNGNEQAVFFGSFRLKQVLDKTEYQEEEKLNLLIGSEMKKLERVLNMNTPVYFVAEGPLGKDGSPKAVHLFLEVTNKDSLIAELSQRSFDVEEKGDFAFTQDGDFVLGIKDNLAIVTISGEDQDAEKLIKANFKATENDPIEGRLADLLDTKTDFSFVLNLEKLYAGSDTDLNKLSAAKHKELNALVKDAIIHTTVSFDHNSVILESKNYFSDALKKELFFRSDDSGSIVNKLNGGEGLMLAGLSFNLDMRKMENWYNKYSPESLEGIQKLLGMDSKLSGLVGGSRFLSNLGNGQFGLTVLGDPSAYSVNINSFLGANEPGKMLFSLVQHNIPLNLKYEYKDDGVYGSGSVMSEGVMNAEGKVDLPNGCSVFGKKGITAFVSFDGIDLEEFGFSGPMRLLEIVEYATFEYDENGGKLFIKAIDGEDHILKDVMGILMDELASEIGGIAI